MPVKTETEVISESWSVQHALRVDYGLGTWRKVERIGWATNLPTRVLALAAVEALLERAVTNNIRYRIVCVRNIAEKEIYEKE